MTRPQRIRARLLDWYDHNRRDLPWRGVDDPYAIWVSEVMSQQTRVETVVEYWQRWLERFPDVETLAGADEDQVLAVWSGLGYYRRARFLLEAAQLVMQEHDGEMPTTFEGLCELPGIGEYTAGAIASIAFDEAVPAVDGNVTRVVSRLFAIGGEPHRAPFRRAIRERAESLVDPDRPGASNEALMEQGATVCTPTSPSCLLCSIREECEAFATGDPEAFPPARKRKPPRPERRTALVFRRDGRFWMRKRTRDGLLAGLWEFPNWVETEASHEELAETKLGVEIEAAESAGEVEHVFSHIQMTYDVWVVGADVDFEEGRWLAPDDLDGLGVSRAMRKVAAAARRAAEAARSGRD